MTKSHRSAPEWTAQIRIDSIEYQWTEDKWGLSCVAVAEVSYRISDDNDRRLEWLSSGGTHGIDTQSSPEYLHEIELDELANLHNHLGQFGLRYTRSELNTLVTPKAVR